MKEFFKPLNVSLTPRDIRHHYNEREKLPAHDKVIRPLFAGSINTYVYGLRNDSEMLRLNNSILVWDKGKYKFDKNMDCITGHEYLWNATSWKRGSIVMILRRDFDFREIFRHCYRPGITENPNTGNSPSATKRCKEEVKRGNIAICFPASNGIEWVQIYTDTGHIDKLWEVAYENCHERDWT